VKKSVRFSVAFLVFVWAVPVRPQEKVDDMISRIRYEGFRNSKVMEPASNLMVAVIVASFVYEAAMREHMLPRKPIEMPLAKEPEKADN
jgi:hypothetical protein